MDTTVTFTWTLNGSALLNDPPHIRIREDNRPVRSASLLTDDSTSVLTVDNFRDTDNGVYQCTATKNGTDSTDNGTALALTAISSTSDGTLILTNQPSNNEPTDIHPDLNDNRTGIALGDSTPLGNPGPDPLLTCTAGHHGDELMNYSPPSVVWVRNGQVVDDTDPRITLTNTTMANGQVTSSLTITNFSPSDAGVYQCVFTDDSDGGDTELITSIPYRLDTGNIIRLERVSPDVIILRPPEKLVIEVRVSGEYSVVFWGKDASSFIPRLMRPQEFPNFYEIFIRDNTTEDEFGIYPVTPQFKSGTEQTHTLTPTGGVSFAVIRPDDANTTALSDSVVVIPEGGNGTISCRSMGAPVPSITWEFNNQTTVFEQTDTETPYEATLTGEPGNRGFDLTPGNIVSTLHIVSARYPDHDGVYTCIGSNADDLTTASSSASVSVQIHVLPEVTVVATPMLINIGEDVTIQCSVTRGNPSYNDFTIVHVDNSTTVSSSQTAVLTNVQLSDLGMYRCDVTNAAGAGSDSVTIEQGEPPGVSTLQPAPVVVDTTVDLVCVVTGDTPIVIVWEHVLTDGSVEVFTGNDTTGGNFTLTVTMDDYGTYRCNASNRFGMDSSSIEIDQAVGPVVILSGKDPIQVETSTRLSVAVTITSFNLPLTEITWFIDGTPATEVIDRTGALTITDTGTTSPPATSTLILDPVLLPIEGGQYSVRAVNPAGMVNLTFTVTVTSAAIITFPATPVNLTVTEGDQTTLTCTARGVPAPEFVWYSGNDRVDGLDTRLQITSTELFNETTEFIFVTSELNISIINRADSGLFTCTASNTPNAVSTNDSQNYQVTVNFPPTILEDPVRDSAFAPDSVSVMCRVSGQPTPNVIWIKIALDGSETMLSPSSTTEQGVTVASTLTIDSTNISDTGSYSCRAMNSIGNTTSNQAEVVIYVGAQITSPMNGDEFRVNETTNFITTCTATGLPTPMITFLNASGQPFSSQLASRLVRQNDSTVMLVDSSFQVTATLFLINAMDEDTGNVTCQAVNTVDELNQTMTDTITVSFIVNVAPSITSPSMSVSVVSPGPAMFSCTADGVPQPDITWWRVDDGTEMVVMEDPSTQITTTTLSDRLTMSVLSFIETGPLLSGVYACLVSNLLGSDRESAQFTVNVSTAITFPATPVALTVTEGDQTTLTCTARGIPAPQFVWYRESELISSSDTRLQISSNEMFNDATGFIVTSELNITVLNRTDSGMFTCTASNIIDGSPASDSQNYQVTVNFPATIIEDPVRDSAFVLDSVSVMCRVSGSPVPTVTWIVSAIDGSESVLTPTSTTEHGVTVTSTLAINSTSISDTGNYSCRAMNLVGNTTSNQAEVVIYVGAEVTSPMNGDELRANETTNFTTTCTATGLPAPTITFLSGTESLESVRLVRQTDSAVMLGDGSFQVTATLFLINAMDEDTENVTCQAVNTVEELNQTMVDAVTVSFIVNVAPSITSPPMNVSVVSPDPAMFSCTADGVPQPDITWWRVDNGNEVEVVEDSSTQIITTHLGDRLTISNLSFNKTQPFRSGSYICLATNLLKTARSIAVLIVNVISRILAPLENFIYTVDENTPVTFNCSATGIPAPTISWLRIDMPVTFMNGTLSLISPSQVDETYQLPNGRGTAFLVTSMLTIPATQDEDSGQYACQAVNEAGNETREFELIVQVAPEIMRTPGDVEIVEGMSAEFICNATGRPRPTITWYRTVNDGNTQQPVNLSDPRVTVTVSNSGDRELTSTLTLSDTLPSDAADYVCVAKNAVVGGRDTATGTLTVNVLPTVTSVYPIAGQMSYTVNETEPVTFECTATGIPAPNVQFNFSTIANRVQVAAPSTSVEVVRRSDGETIFEITRTATTNSTVDADSGVYVCTATNDASEVAMDSAQFELIVQVAPTFTQEPVSLTVIRDSNAVFECQASGVPRPTISWEYSDPVSMSTTTIANDGTNYTVTELTDSSNDRLLTSTLTVLATDTADFGTYRCVATNVVAMNSVSAMLTVHVPAMITSPEPGLQLVVNQTNSVTFICSATGIPTPLIQWYRVDLLLNGNGSDINERVTLTSNVNPSSLGRIVERVSMLTVSSTVGNDSDDYTCVATNELINYTVTVESRVEEIINLFVQVPPEVVPLVGNQMTNESESVTLRFRIDNAAPSVIVFNIRWFYSANFETSDPCFADPGLFQQITNLANRTSSSTLIYSSDRLSLTIGNIVQARAVGEETDQGRYFLQATNEAGCNSEPIDVIVFGQPVIINPPMDQFAINNGSSASFLCNALADPMHTISWTFTDSNGAKTEIATNNSKYSTDMDRNTTRFGELTVMNVDYEDRGIYTCTATNSIGSVEASANLTVHVTPEFNDISGLTEVNISTPAVLACLATGFPVSTISWRKNGEELNIYSDVSLNSRIDIIEFAPDSMVANDTDFQSSGYMGSGSIVGLLMMHTDVTVIQVLQLGELGVISLLSFEWTVREDTANYTCVATNTLPETAILTSASNKIPLFILERPDPPVNVTVISFGARWVALRWTPTFDGNRRVIYFSVYISDTSDSITLNVNSLMTSEGNFMYNISGEGRILPYTDYCDTVVSCNEIGCSDQSDPSPVVRTEQDTSTPPVNITASADEFTISLSWSAPVMPNGVITHYGVSYEGARSYDPGFTDNKGPQQLPIDQLQLPSSNLLVMTLTELSPNTDYTVTVFAVNGAGPGMPATARATTLNVPPPPPVSEPATVSPGEVINSDPRTVTIKIVEFDDTNVFISHYQVIVVYLPSEVSVGDLEKPDDQFPQNSLERYNDIPCGSTFPTSRAYVTAEMSREQYNGLLINNNGRFVVGQNMNDRNSPNDRPDLYTNGPLCYSTKYSFFFRAFAAPSTNSGGRRSVRQVSIDMREYNNFISSPYLPSETTIISDPLFSTIIPAVVAVVVVVVLIIVIIIVVVVIIVVVRRRRTYVYKTTRPDTTDNGQNIEGLKLTEYKPPDEGTTVRNPIPLSLLPAHLERMHLNENCGFGEEYRIIQDNSPKHSVDTCTTAENKPRNRYGNIQCFDKTRVILTTFEGAEHDYINANFIEGYNRPNEYIAAQGPLPDTLGDFWRMIWDHNVPTIVMLTNLVEKMKIKCSQYWPNASHQQYANVDVTIVNTVTQSDFVIRHFQIKKVNSDEVRDIRQFHFVSWPDFGVPRHATPLLHFLRRVRNMHSYSNERPLLIHCSAGVGRTGTLITIDVELQRAMKQGVVDPFNFVAKTREQRNHMVQTEAQYVFLHDAILEGVTSGATEVKVEKLGPKFAELEKQDEDGETGFQKEYNRLRQFKVDVKEFTDANDDANKFKNRIFNALPYNYNRVHLQMSPGISGSDYINASFIDGYANKGCYIATQGPLANTVDDFWRMIWEKEVYVIVMLTQLEEKGKEQCSKYWPDSVNSPEKMGSLSIELLAEKQYEDYILRELKISDVTATDGKSRIVKQYHFTAWPEDSAPSSGAGMIDLIDQVTRTQAHTGNKPIVVHCSAGVGRTGAFCALSISIDRVKTEGVVDVFHCVKHLRTQRPHMVQSVEQYAFCYVAIREYIESLSSYSNFV